jgi:hypothetical protein
MQERYLRALFEPIRAAFNMYCKPRSSGDAEDPVDADYAAAILIPE